MEALQCLMVTLHSTEKYSDLEICSKGSVFKVHRAIVCTQSKVLDDGSRIITRKGSRQGRYPPTYRIDLDEEPVIVAAITKYLYTHDYNDHGQTMFDDDSWSSTVHSATSSVDDSDTPASNINSSYAESLSDSISDLGQEDPSKDVIHPILFNALVRVHGKKYNLGLQMLSTKKYKRAVEEEWDIGNFIQSLEVFYNNDAFERPDELDWDTTLLKDTAMIAARGHIDELLEEEAFERLLSRNGEIAFHILKSVVVENREKLATQSSTEQLTDEADSIAVPDPLPEEAETAAVELLVEESDIEEPIEEPILKLPTEELPAEELFVAEAPVPEEPTAEAPDDFQTVQEVEDCFNFWEIKKKKKKGIIIEDSLADSHEAAAEPPCVPDPPPASTYDWSDWGASFNRLSKKKKKKELEVSDDVPVFKWSAVDEDIPVIENAPPTQDAASWRFTFAQPVPAESEASERTAEVDNWRFGSKKDKRSKRANFDSVLSEPVEAPAIEDSVPVVEDEFSSKKSKKKKKAASSASVLPEPVEAPVIEESVPVVEDEFSSKKSKKKKKAASSAFVLPEPVEAPVVEESVPVVEDEFSSKKSKKKKKAASSASVLPEPVEASVIEDSVPFVEDIMWGPAVKKDKKMAKKSKKLYDEEPCQIEVTKDEVEFAF